MTHAGLPLSWTNTVINSFTGSAQGDPSYVLAMACDTEERVTVVAGAEFDLKVYDRQTLSCMGPLGRHAERINELAVAPGAAVEARSLVYSASSDGTTRAWDCRVDSPTKGQVACLQAGRDEVWSISPGEGHLLAAGTQTSVLVWDLRHATKPVSQWEVHTDAVTQVRFQPGSATTLLSASLDGLLCALDCRQTDEEAAVTAIHNVASPVSALGFFGEAPSSHVYCLTSLEELLVWDMQQGSCVAEYRNIRREISSDDEAAQAGGGASAPGIDYLIGCVWDATSHRLTLLAGEHSGVVHMLAVEPGSLVALHSLGSTMAHDSDVRCYHWGRSSLLTAGDDARICMWTPVGTGSTPAPSGRSEQQGGKANRTESTRRHTPY